MRNAAAVYDRHSNIIDELLGNEYPRIPDGAKNLADRQRRRRVPAHDSVTFLKLSCHSVFQPEQMVRLETLSQPRCFDWRQPVMRIVQKMNVTAVLDTKRFE